MARKTIAQLELALMQVESALNTRNQQVADLVEYVRSEAGGWSFDSGIAEACLDIFGESLESDEEVTITVTITGTVKGVAAGTDPGDLEVTVRDRTVTCRDLGIDGYDAELSVDNIEIEFTG